MDPERTHQSSSSSTGSDLFRCLTSRLCSMKISSKSILNPGSSKRLRRINGSVKGGGQASPMFSNGKSKGCAIQNPEPSSPKVTCTGQVRVKTKKHGKKFRAFRSKRSGEVSFRKVDHDINIVNNGSNSHDNMGHLLSNNSHHHHHRHQQQQQQQECEKKWVHLPLIICETLRVLGAEFNCFLPCSSSSSSCVAKHRDKEDKTGSRSGWNNIVNGNGSSQRRHVFEDIEINDYGNGNGSSQRRHVFEDIEINDCGNEKMGYEEDQDQARVNICIPPKNALLLMRCRSDPVKMAALANKFRETPLPKDEEEEEEEEVQGDDMKFEQELEHQEATEEQETPEAEKIIEYQAQEQENEVDEDLQGSTMKEESLTQVPFDLEKLQGEETETTQGRPELECPETMEPDPEDESKGGESQQNLLPDSLLLMICEPKFSTEVSKETWLSSRDFIGWLPEKKKQPLVKQKDGGDEAPKGRISIDYNAAAVSLQPPRSSCSFPMAAPPPKVTAATAGNGTGGGGSTSATVVQQKLVRGSKGYEPFVLRAACRSR